MNKSTALPLQSFILCAIIIVVAHNGTTANSVYGGEIIFFAVKKGGTYNEKM